MPRLLLTDSFVRPLIIDIDEPVGKDCPNRKLDVYVVQFLLKSAFDSPRNNKNIDILPAQPLQIDGVFGEKTLEAIRFFQNFASSGTLEIDHDERIDPVHHASYRGSASGKFRTISRLSTWERASAFHGNRSLNSAANPASSGNTTDSVMPKMRSSFISRCRHAESIS